MKSRKQFLLIISHDEAFAPGETLVAEIFDWIADMERRGFRVHGNPLRPPGEAITVRVRKGKVTRKTGPFADSGEKMCAYELLACADIDEAVAAAARHPMAKVATIEVRPVWAELT